VNPRPAPVKKILQSGGKLSGCKVAPNGLLNGLHNRTLIKWIESRRALHSGTARFGQNIQGWPGDRRTSQSRQTGRDLIEQPRRNLRIESAAEAATKLGIHFTAAKCGEEDRVPFHPAIETIPENAAVFQKQTLPDLVGGTAWVFSRLAAQGQFDYLFIDEAGQVSLAKLVGMAPSASNLILLGDQMQLSQPIRGVHPGESGTSILDYYLQDHATVPEDLGIFLPKTWRMRPEICSFISNAVYDGRLQHELCTETRSILLIKESKHLHRSSGLLYVPVGHEGNTYEFDEEMGVVKGLVAELIGQTLGMCQNWLSIQNLVDVGANEFTCGIVKRGTSSEALALA
jgi:hypothetical protein